MKLGSSISGVCQVACAFFGRKELESFADGEANSFDGSGGSFSEEMFELGEALFDRVQVGRVLGQEEELGSCGADELTHDSASVVPDHDIAGTNAVMRSGSLRGPGPHPVSTGLVALWRLVLRRWEVSPAENIEHGLPRAIELELL
jgi:hypothetical protein